MPSANEHFRLLLWAEWGSACFLTQIIYRKPYSKQGCQLLIGKRVTHLTKEVLQKMRSDASFKSFYDAVILKSKNYSSMMPRRTRAPRRIEICTGEPAYPATTQDYYRQIYFDQSQRFDQPTELYCICKDGVPGF